MKRLPNFLLMMLTAVLLATFITSCSESSSDSDPSSPTQPQTPVAEGDWQVVPATGGTIEKGDITITFPSGTFSGETKVAITEVRRGDVLGTDEVSKFYQLTMPATVGKELTIKVKCDEPDDDIRLITYVPSCSMHHPDEVTYAPLSYDATYSKGEYTATLSASENKGSNDEISFSIGLAHRVQFSNSSDINGSRAGTRRISGETEGLITWYFDTDRVFETDNAQRLTDFLDDLNGYIHTSIKQITNLGFTLREPRRLTILFSKRMGSEEWGLFKQHWSNDSKSWLELNAKMITDANVNTNDVKQTIIHELLHYFQADYDQRIPFIKYRNCKEDELLMYEAGGQWIEKFMNNNKVPFNSNLYNRLKHFMKGLLDIEEIYKDVDVAAPNGSFNIGFARQSHGYSMAALFEYWAQEIGDGKIVDIYHHWNSDASGVGIENKPTFETLKDFAAAKKLSIFEGGYDAFIWACADEVVVPGFKVVDFDSEMKRITVNDNSILFNGKCYAYGADAKQLMFVWNSTESLIGRKLVFRPETDYIKTYLYKMSANNKYELFRYMPLERGDSIVIDGDELERHRGADGAIRINYYFLNTSYATEAGKGINYQLQCKLMKDEEINASVSPTELTFPAEGNTQSVKVTAQGFTKFGYKISDEYKSWISAKNVKGGTIEITAQPNTTGKERIGYVRVYVCNEEKPTEAQKVYLKDSIKVTQAANKEPEQQESAYELLGGGVNMYYAVEWRSEIEFKDGDDRVTITPSGKGAKVQIQQSGEDTGRNAEWEYTLSFDVDDLSLYDSKQAKISNFKYEFYKEGKGYDYYGNHVDWEKSETLMTSNAPMQQTAYGNWRFESQDLSYYGLSITHFDKYRTDPYSSYTEHTDKSETKEMTPGSNVTIWLTIKKK